MESISIMHISDTHLGNRQYGIAEREQDVYTVFDEAIDVALKEHVDLVIHTGDFFDSVRPPAQAFRQAILSLRKLKEKNIPVVAILGDHDIPRRRMLPPPVLLEELKEALDFKVVGLKDPEKVRIRTKHGEVLVAGVTAQRGPARRQRLLDIFKKLALVPSDKPTILMLHQTLHEVGTPDFDIELGELPRGYSYYAMGHIHLFKTFMLGDSAVVYPGSIEVFRRDEARQPKRYVVLAEIKAKETVNMEGVVLKNVRPQLLREIVYTNAKAFESTLAKLRIELSKYEKKPLLHVILKKVPLTTKKRVRMLLDQSLQGLCLAYRVEFEEVIEDSTFTTLNIRRTRHIDIAEMLREALKDKELADLAYKLIEILGSETRQDTYDEALRLVKRFYGLDEDG